MDDSTTNNTNELKIFFIERDISCQNKTTSSNYSNLFSKSISSYEFIKKDLESLLNGFNFTIKINLRIFFLILLKTCLIKNNKVLIKKI